MYRHLYDTHKKNPEHLIPCTYCEQEFFRLDNLNRHISNIHKTDKCFSCPICEENFSRQDNGDRHINDVHKSATPFCCSRCEKEFSRIESLERHISEVHLKNMHKCPKCQMDFTREETLDRHISDVHKKEKKWECHLCPENYSRWENLKRHLDRDAHTFFIEGGCPYCKEDPSFKSQTAMNAHFVQTRWDKQETCVTMKKRRREAYQRKKKMWEEEDKKRRNSRFDCSICKKTIVGYEKGVIGMFKGHLVYTQDRKKGIPVTTCQTMMLNAPLPREIAMKRTTPLEFDSIDHLLCGCGCGCSYYNTDLTRKFHY